ncbi:MULTISPECIES: DUF3450 domain-containing protein [unclassified Wenzhouxiangella]|uniref:DUF3450 domain-containing protein n=1 Tax=unclassified Wenzhouxiangella TaxID=2613841 RepID=UPI000E327F2E|nr:MULTISPECIES: DUF3450 domain-containing protein [unclassified Wenzhouxiangella]RFF27289.1 DUF3450 domain-containing protein [Wenzhouxiangella sp. 15181]RFP68722.1 DUF3450 domain-containing protein [Wenzhouxiangella sp. 15190]
MKILTKRRNLGLGLAAIGSALMLATFSVHTQEIDPILETSRQAAEDTAGSQERIDEIDSETQRMLNDYRANLKQLEQLERYNASQERQIESQREELASLEEDINNIASLQRAMQPLMDDMVGALDRLVEADLPFLMDERSSRIERLQAAIEDPELSPAQRFRLVIEAYQIENEYGRTIETYRGDIETGGRVYENVEFLRIGRVALIFRTDNDEVLKRYVPEEDSWVDLDPSYLQDIRTASRIAREQIPPELMYVPVRAPKDAE